MKERQKWCEGSSPRVWGQVLFLKMAEIQPRIIPTRVGTSLFPWDSYHILQDHPHACGDKIFVLLFACKNTGSSPRVWGQALIHHGLKLMKRIIPTRVGTRLCQQYLPKPYRDHPHACGDKGSDLMRPTDTAGSSPRVWGQVSDCNNFRKCQGIIPTRVGTSQIVICCHHWYEDHPHACGDKCCFIYCKCGS